MEYGVKSSRVVKSRRDGDLGPGEERQRDDWGVGSRVQGGGPLKSQDSSLLKSMCTTRVTGQGSRNV
jgi:hypothetical protein